MKIDSDFCTDVLRLYEDYICSICTNILENPLCCSDSDCDSLFCKDCIEGMIGNKCPLCRKSFVGKNMYQMGPSQMDSYDYFNY